MTMRPIGFAKGIKRTLPLAHLRIHCRRLTTTATLPAQVQQVEIPKIIISPGSPHHNSLPSFLEYADRVKLAPSKTVYVGTHYEYTTALALLRLGFSLLRTGRKSDAGIDLIGHWLLPQLPGPLPVIVQCKAWSDSCAPRHVRELEGAFQGIPADWRKKDVLGLLVTTQKATKGVLEALGLNRYPMGFLKITRSGTIEQLLWNRAAGQRGLEGVGVTIRHTPRILLPDLGIEEQGEEGSGWECDGRRKGKHRRKFPDAGTKRDIQVTWMGTPIFPDREGPSEETVRLVKEHIQVDGEPESVDIPKKKKAAKTTVGGTVKKARGRPPVSKTQKPVNTGTGVGCTGAPKRGRPLGSKNKVKRGRGKP